MPEEGLGETMEVVVTDAPIQVADGKQPQIQPDQLLRPNYPGAGLPSLASEFDAFKAALPQAQQDQVSIVEPAQPQSQQQMPIAAQPTQPGPTLPTVPAQDNRVPDKFLRQDGSVDVDRLTKAYREAERALTQTRQTLRQFQPSSGLPIGPLPQPQVDNQPQASLPFEAQIEADIKQQGFGVTLARLFDAAKQAAAAETMQHAQSVYERLEERSRADELRSIGQSDPWIFTEQGLNALKSVREANPWINQAPEPWRAAYTFYKGSLGGQAKGQVQQVMMPTPRGPAAPIAPAGPVNMPRKTISLNDAQALNSHLDKLSVDEQKKFWAQYGLKY